MDPLDPIDIDDVAARFAAAGLLPPPERRNGTYANAARLLQKLHWLRTERPMSAEPATIMRASEWMK